MRSKSKPALCRCDVHTNGVLVCLGACVCVRARDWSVSRGPTESLAPITVPCTSAAILLSTVCPGILPVAAHTRPHHKNFTNSLSVSPHLPLPLTSTSYEIISVSRVSFLPRVYFSILFSQQGVNGYLSGPLCRPGC